MSRFFFFYFDLKTNFSAGLKAIYLTLFLVIRPTKKPKVNKKANWHHLEMAFETYMVYDKSIPNTIQCYLFLTRGMFSLQNQ